MLKETIEYNFGIPINTNILTIFEYPYHYHPSIELILVLKGTIFLKNGSNEVILRQNDIALIDSGRLHKISSDDKNNIVLLFHIDIDYYKRYFQNIGNTLFSRTIHNDYSLSDVNNTVREQVLEISMALFRDSEPNFKKVEYISKSLIYNLLENYQYYSLKFKELLQRKELKDNQINFERMQRIIGYIYNQFDSKIKLEEISNWEHLNHYYLSHLIKYSTGMSYQDLLSLIRVEASTILLLGTNNKISEIAKSIGFSATKYYNKYFEKWYHMSPDSYRDQNMSHKIKDKNKDFISYNKEGNRYINNYIQEGRVLVKFLENSPTSIINLDIGLKGTHFKNPLVQTVKITNANSSLYENTRLLVIDLKKDFKIVKAGVNISYIDYLDLRNNDFMTIATNINFLLQEGIEVFFIIDQLTNHSIICIENFLKFYVTRFRNSVTDIYYSIWINSPSQAEKIENFKKRLNDKIKTIIDTAPLVEIKENQKKDLIFTPCIYDSFILTPFAMDELFHPDNWQLYMDFVATDSVRHDGNIMEGGHGLLTWNGIKKPWYYAYGFLAKMKGEILKSGDDYAITRNGNEIIIIAYNLCGYSYSSLKKIRTKEDLKNFICNTGYSKEHIFRLKGLQGEYKMTCYTLDQDCCLFSRWMDLGFPEYLSEEEEKNISLISHPKIRMSHIHASGILEVTAMNLSFGVTCIVLDKV